MTERETAELLKTLADNYTNHKITDPAGTVKAYHLTLQPYEASDIFKAARLHMATCEFMPNPAELIRRIPKAQIIYAPPKMIGAENAKEPETGCGICPYSDLCHGINCIV